MRQCYLSLIAAATIFFAASSLAADESPYEAVVLDQGAVVRAGPGQRFYVTQELEPGTRVEVYRKEAGDWLAIRPPEGSFSWIPQADLEMTDEPGIAEVASDETQSWLGSRAERIKVHKSHVTLSRGERVEVLGKKQIESPDGKTQLWLKIAPPAGEFRWVSSLQVRRVKHSDLATKKKQKAAEENIALPAKSIAAAKEEAPSNEPRRTPHSYIVLSDLREAEPKVEPEVRQAAHEEPVKEVPEKGLSPDGFVARKRRSGSGQDSEVVASRPAPHSSKNNSSSRQQPVASVGGSGSAVDHQAISHDLEELDLQLSLILSRDKSTWDFSPLKQRVEKLIETAATPAERGEARFLLDKIKRFEETFDVQPVFEAKSAPITANREVRSYDGEGRLSAVKSADKPVAPYALLDESGKRICFVTPSPGLGISSHLNKRVGVYGKRGIIADLNEPHVLASRVIELDRIR